MLNLSTIIQIATAVASLATSLTLLIGIIQLRQASLSEIRRRKDGAYDALDEKFVEFQKLCLNHPDLDIFDVPDATIRSSLDASDAMPLADTAVESPLKLKQEVIAFTLLFSIFERAFVMYLDQDSRTRELQWSGWDEYIRDFSSRENFRFAWKLSGSTYDVRFQTYMARVMAEVAPAVTSGAPALR